MMMQNAGEKNKNMEKRTKKTKFNYYKGKKCQCAHINWADCYHIFAIFWKNLHLKLEIQFIF